VNNEGAKYTGPITNGDHITNKTYVDGKVGEVADTPLTFAGNNGTPVQKKLGETLDIIGGLTDGKSSSAENIRTVTNDKGQLELQLAKNLTGLESVTVEDANGNKTYISPTGTSVRDVLGNSSSMVAGGTVVEDIAGNRTTMSSGVVNIKDGHGTTIVKGDGLTINDGPAFTSSKVDVAGNKIINVAAGTNLTDAVNVSQLKEAGNELTAKGLNFAGNSGEFHRDLGQKVTIKGEGTKGDDQYTGQSVKTIADADGNITVMLDNNFKSETVTTNEITLAGKDGINGKDGISLKASDGAPGLDGKPGNSRIIYKKPDGSTEEVATLNDGLKFKGNQGKAIDKKLNQQLEIVGGLADGKTSSAENIRTVTNDKGQLEIQLAKNLTGLESAKIGDVFINGKTNTIEGLSNKDFSAKDFATKGRSATEEQLKLVKDAQQETDDYAVKYDKKDGKVNRDSVTLGGTTANSTQATDGRITTTGGTSLSNVATAGDYTDVKNASNGVNAGDLNNAVIDVTNKGLSFAGNSGSPVQKKLGETLDIVGGLADGKTSSAENIRTVTNDEGQLEIQLAKNLTGLESAKIGEVFINGKTNTIEGLSNKDFSAKDFATKGRSATEEQLKLVKDAQQETDDYAVKYDKKDGKVNRDSVTLGGTTADSVINDEGSDLITTTGGTSLSNLASAGDYTKLENASKAVNAGDLNNAVVNVTDKGMSFAANTGSVKKKLGETLDIVGGMDSKEETAASAENIRTVMNDEGQLEIQLAKNLTGLESAKIGEVFINGKTNTIEGLSNITLGGDDFATKGRAATEEQLNYTQQNLANIFGGNAVNTGGNVTFTDIGNTGEKTIHDAISSINDKANNANQGWNLSANGEGKTAVKPGSTVDFTGDGKNINVSKDDKNNIKVELGKDIDLGKDGSIKAGDTTINKDGIKTGDTTINGDGLTIAGGPSVTKDGIDAGGKKITGVEDGTIAAGSKDAVNGGQLHDAIGKATAEAKTEVKAGNNITVKKDKGANGQDVYEVATSDDVKFKNVETDNLKVGDVNIGKGGINAGGTVISGVKDGAVNKDSKEAVNGSQLNSSNQKNAEFFGGGTKYENGEWTAPTYNVNGGSYHNVGDALGALNEADKNLGDRITNLGDRVDQGFYQTNKRIGDVEKAANAGIAAAMALESAPFVAGKYTYAAGASYHGGEQAIGVTLRKTSDNGRWSITGGVAAATEGDASFRIGVSGVID
ncbi:trimeric autotransporter adhesin, partial [Acinetobacter calcoaceticus]